MNALAYQTTEMNMNNTFIIRTNRGNIQDLLLNIGFPQHVYGYNYIIYALELISVNPEILHHALLIETDSHMIFM